MSYLKNQRAPSAGDPDDSQPHPDDEKQFPAIVEFCCALEGPDGKKRETSTITLFWDQGMWKACVNDRDRSVSGFFSDRRLAGLLDRLELALEEGSIDWRVKKPFRKK